MTLPFTTDQFFEVFAIYNRAIWPAHVVAYGAAAVLLLAILTRQAWSGRAAGVVLGALWTWNGLVYHGLFFATVNPAAYGFAALFAVQGALFLRSSLGHNALAFDWVCDARTAVASVTIAYATLIYGLLGVWAGHVWPGAPMFGVTPCSMTIFTLGILSLAVPRAPGWLWIIPLAWAAIGSTAALLLGVVEDLGLLAAAAASLAVRAFAPARAPGGPKGSPADRQRSRA